MTPTTRQILPMGAWTFGVLFLIAVAWPVLADSERSAQSTSCLPNATGSERLQRFPGLHRGCNVAVYVDGHTRFVATAVRG